MSKRPPRSHEGQPGLFGTLFVSSWLLFLMILVASLGVIALSAQGPADVWVASWTASAHGPYPSGNAVAQPILDFALPSATTGADNQTFRLMIRPDLWGQTVRVRFTNVFGT